MCDHKYRLTENDKLWLKRHLMTPYDCAQCDKAVRNLPHPKLRIEKPKDSSKGEDSLD